MNVRGQAVLLPELRTGAFYVADDATPIGEMCFCEDTSDRFDIFGFRCKAIVCSVQTDFQNVLIADTMSFGRALLLDGVLQSSEFDESLYHELLVQPAMLSHPNPRDVLIIGGGEGATLREVLAHRSVRRAVMVDIDEVCVQLCKQYLGSWHQGAMEDSRVRMVFEDGRTFVEQDSGFYDVVIIDVVDHLENGPAQRIYTQEFYHCLRKRIRPGGVVVAQGMEFSHVDHAQHAALVRTLRTAFQEVHSYQSLIPSFLASWGFVLASDHVRPYEWSATTLDANIVYRLGNSCLQHVDGSFIKSRFELCLATRKMLSMPGPVLDDSLSFVKPLEPEFVDDSVAVFPARSAVG